MTAYQTTILLLVAGITAIIVNSHCIAASEPTCLDYYVMVTGDETPALSTNEIWKRAAAAGCVGATSHGPYIDYQRIATTTVRPNELITTIGPPTSEPTSPDPISTPPVDIPPEPIDDSTPEPEAASRPPTRQIETGATMASRKQVTKMTQINCIPFPIPKPPIRIWGFWDREWLEDDDTDIFVIVNPKGAASPPHIDSRLMIPATPDANGWYADVPPERAGQPIRVMATSSTATAQATARLPTTAGSQHRIRFYPETD